MCGSLIFLCQFLADRTAQAEETTRIAPASNGTEIGEIHIVRRSSLLAVKGADLTTMQLQLWFPWDLQWDHGRSPTLVHIQELNAIEDDTGRVLSTENRLQQIESLRGEVRSGYTGVRDRQGPYQTLLLDAPAHGAGKIKAIKGRAKVTLTKTIPLTFKDLAAINGEVLDHPDMKDLAAMKFRFSIEEKDGSVDAKLSAPVKYACPWHRGRLHSWELIEGEGALGTSSDGSARDGEGLTGKKSYRRRTFKGLSLRLYVLEAVKSKTYDFDFQNVELP